MVLVANSDGSKRGVQMLGRKNTDFRYTRWCVISLYEQSQNWHIYCRYHSEGEVWGRMEPNTETFCVMPVKIYRQLRVSTIPQNFVSLWPKKKKIKELFYRTFYNLYIRHYIDFRCWNEVCYFCTRALVIAFLNLNLSIKYLSLNF